MAPLQNGSLVAQDDKMDDCWEGGFQQQSVFVKTTTKSFIFEKQKQLLEAAGGSLFI